MTALASHQYDWVDWLRLTQVNGVGNETARKLLSAFGLPSQIFQAEYAALTQFVSERIAKAITQPSHAAIEVHQRQIELTLNWCEQAGNQILSLADAAYPKTLLDIPDPPILIYVKGHVDLLSSSTVAIVGSRNATTQGIQNAEQFAEALSQAGFTISSGLAAGIDAAAHQGGLRGIGSTIAVIGTGADIVYPARHRGLAHLIADQGCIVSEYPLGMPAIAANFPRRNRIISGLAQGVLIVEAAAQSGSLITARMAAEQGRDVFAIPGSIHSPLAKGCHQLIKQGAKLVETAQDIMDELGVQVAALHEKRSVESSIVNAIPEPVEHDVLLDQIGFDPIHIDLLVERCGLSMAELSARLFALELQGALENLPGGRVQRLGK